MHADAAVQDYANRRASVKMRSSRIGEAPDFQDHSVKERTRMRKTKHS